MLVETEISETRLKMMQAISSPIPLPFIEKHGAGIMLERFTACGALLNIFLSLSQIESTMLLSQMTQSRVVVTPER